MQDKFLGTFIQDNVYDLRARCRPIRATCGSSPKSSCSSRSSTSTASRSPIPKGTNLHADITEEMAQRWAAGAYQRGHLYMFPNQATGRFGYSFVNYPAFQAEVAAARADRADRGRPRRHAGPRRLLPALGDLLQERVHLRRQGRRRAGRGAEGVPAVSRAERPDLPVPQPAGLLVSLRNRLRLASQELPPSGRHGRNRQHQSGTRALGRDPLGPRHPSLARPGRARPNRRSGASSPKSTTSRSITAGTRRPTSRPTRSGCATPTSGSTCSTRGT